MTPGNHFKEARLAKPMTQEELAIAADISVRTVRRLENGDPVAAESRRAVAAVLGMFEETKEPWFKTPMVRWEMKPAIAAYIGWVLLLPYWLVCCIALHPFPFFMLLLSILGTWLPVRLAGVYGEQLWGRRELVIVVGAAAGITAFAGSIWMILDGWYWHTVSEALWAQIGISGNIVVFALTICTRTDDKQRFFTRAAETVFSLGDPRAHETVRIKPHATQEA